MTFELHRPASGAVPLVVEVPHAGTEIPEELSAQFCVSAEDVRRDADLFVDQLVAGAKRVGAAVLTTRVSRYVVDLNRAVHEVDRAAVLGATDTQSFPHGLIWRETTRGEPVLVRALSRDEFDARMEKYYVPYHRALESTLRELRHHFGFVIMICAHSMPSMGVISSGEHVIRQRRADIVPGTRGRTSASEHVIQLVESHFRNAGLSVRTDEPYRGGATTVRWGRPREDIHVVQLEINRRLYLNETSLHAIDRGMSWLTILCASLFGRIAQLEHHAL